MNVSGFYFSWLLVLGEGACGWVFVVGLGGFCCWFFCLCVLTGCYTESLNS